MTKYPIDLSFSKPLFGSSNSGLKFVMIRQFDEMEWGSKLSVKTAYDVALEAQKAKQ